MGEGEYTTRGTVVPVGAANTPLIGPDPRRVALVVSNTNGVARLTMKATGSPGGDVQIGVSADTVLTLTFKDHGPLAAYGWEALFTMGGESVGIIEVLYLGKRG